MFDGTVRICVRVYFYSIKHKWALALFRFWIVTVGTVCGIATVGTVCEISKVGTVWEI